MFMTKLRSYTLLALVLASAGQLAPSDVSAQEATVTGPLAGQPAVRHMRIYRRNRLQAQPLFGFTMQDPYRRSFFLGGQLQYHFTDGFGIGIWGGYGGLGVDTDLTREVENGGVTTPRNRLSMPTRGNFSEQLGIMNWAAAAQLTFVPLRGKLALFQRGFADTDFYLFGGVAFVGIEERANIDAASCDGLATSGEVATCYEASQLARDSRIALTGTFGAGLNMYFADWFGLSIEWRGLPFKMNESGTDERGQGGSFPDGRINASDRTFRLHHMFSLGFVFYLPGRVQISE
jgi:outer membrane beta-barrel protein